jgi:flagellin
MSLSINNNLASLLAQQSLLTTQVSMAQEIQALSSGKAISSAAGNPAGLAISQSLVSQINAVNQTIQNLSDATNMLQTADSGLSSVQDILLKMKTLVTQGQDASLSFQNKSNIASQLDSLNSALNQIASSTSLNGNQLLSSASVMDKEDSSLKIQNTNLGTHDNVLITDISLSNAQTGQYQFTNTGNQLTLSQYDVNNKLAHSQSIVIQDQVPAQNLIFDTLGITISISQTPPSGSQATDNATSIATKLSALINPIIINAAAANTYSFNGPDSANILTIGPVNATTNNQITEYQYGTLTSSSNAAEVTASAVKGMLASPAVHHLTIYQTASPSQFNIAGFDSTGSQVDVSNFYMIVGSNVYRANGSVTSGATITLSQGTNLQDSISGGSTSMSGPVLGSGMVSVSALSHWINNLGANVTSTLQTTTNGDTQIHVQGTLTGVANAVAFYNLGNVAGTTNPGGSIHNRSGNYNATTIGLATNGGLWIDGSPAQFNLSGTTGTYNVVDDPRGVIYNGSTQMWQGPASAVNPLFVNDLNRGEYIDYPTNTTWIGQVGVVTNPGAGFFIPLPDDSGTINGSGIVSVSIAGTPVNSVLNSIETARTAKGSMNGIAFESTSNSINDVAGSGINVNLIANVHQYDTPESLTITTAYSTSEVISQKQAGVDSMGNVGASISNLLRTQDPSNNSGLAWSQAIGLLDSAITTAVDFTSSQRSVIGAKMNVVSYAVQNLNSRSNNLASSNSSIIDTNYASETENLAKNQIKQQAGVQMIRDANNFPSMLKTLMREWGNTSSVG